MSQVLSRSRLVAAMALLSAWSVAATRAEPNPALHPKVRIATSLGDIIVELNAEVAPLTCVNFLQYAGDGYYSGTIFHRVRDHVIQAGGYTADMEEKREGLREAVPNESGRGLKNTRGTIAMYRVPFSPNSARAQFFINLKDNDGLDSLRDGSGYTAFGKVVEGMEVAEKIAKAEVSTNPKYAAGRSAVVPKEPIVIKEIAVLGALDKTKAFEAAADFEQRRKDPLAFKIKELEKKYGKTAKREESGVVTIDIVEGKGPFPVADDTVEINYELSLVHAEKPFDSSQQRWRGPGKLVLKTLLAGMRLGLESMREGGRRIIAIPPALAFGEGGKPGQVPADSPVIFEVELLSVSRDAPTQGVLPDELKKD